MEKIVLFAFVVLAAILMVHGTTNITSTPPPSGSPATTGNDTMKTTGPMNTNVTATPTGTSESATTAAVAAFQPLAIFVLACAFLGLMH